MTWTYNPYFLTSASNAMSATTKLRLLVGDTDEADQQLQDEEIGWVASLQSVLNYAAADCADLIASKYARQCSTVNGALRITASQRQEHYSAMAKRLRANGPGSLPGGDNGGAVLADAYVGGISRTDVDELKSDTDNILPPVAVGQDDYASTQDPTNYFSDDV
jgi:hypothetical protein